MKTIQRLQIPLTQQEYMLPVGAEVVDVVMHRGVPWLVWIGDRDENYETRTFIRETAEAIEFQQDKRYKYIGHIDNVDLLYYIFEVLP